MGTMICRRGGWLRWLMAVGVALAFSAKGVQGTELPRDVREALDILDKRFHGTVGFGTPSSDMERSMAAHRGRIEAVVRWGAAGDQNAAALAGTILSAVDAFTTQFGPGAAIDEAVLRKRSWEFGTQPGHGLVVGTHILLELARQQRLPAGGRQALLAACRAVEAWAHLGEKMELQTHPEDRHEIEKGKQIGGGYRCSFGAQMAWVCEQFMLAELASDHPMLPEAALKVVREYAGWRDEVAVGEGDHYHMGRQHHIMGFARRVAEALPAAPDRAPARAWQRRP
ncbi:MAG: hypothetical protein GX774_18610 [Armatimonadetes bacterium]|nr:hypothetical protein [Armatimonadota bacterium]